MNLQCSPISGDAPQFHALLAPVTPVTKPTTQTVPLALEGHPGLATFVGCKLAILHHILGRHASDLWLAPFRNGYHCWWETPQRYHFGELIASSVFWPKPIFCSGPQGPSSRPWKKERRVSSHDSLKLLLQFPETCLCDVFRMKSYYVWI